MSSYPTTLPVHPFGTVFRKQPTAGCPRQQGCLRNWLTDRREVRTLNRAYRRQRREFEHALDLAQGSPNARLELQAIWATRS